MTVLSVKSDATGDELERFDDHEAIARRLTAIGVTFEHWGARATLPPDAGEEDVIAAYREEIDRLDRRFGFESMDVVSLAPDHPDRLELRDKFLSEHTHADFEVRFFVDGSGLFCLHAGDRVFVLLCEKGDLLSVPANMTHWFDMGERPDFKCIRFFTKPDGWVGDFTGSDISERFPSYDEFVAS